MRICSSEGQYKIKKKPQSDLKVKASGTSGHAEAQGRHINPTVTLPEDVEVIVEESGKLGEETE